MEILIKKIKIKQQNNIQNLGSAANFFYELNFSVFFTGFWNSYQRHMLTF